MDRNAAVTAMTLVDQAAGHDLHENHRLWPHIQSGAVELGLKVPEAISKAFQAPRMDRKREPVGEHPDPEVAD
jgi:hypothetical protein